MTLRPYMLSGMDSSSIWQVLPGVTGGLLLFVESAGTVVVKVNRLELLFMLSPPSSLFLILDDDRSAWM